LIAKQVNRLTIKAVMLFIGNGKRIRWNPARRSLAFRVRHCARQLAIRLIQQIAVASVKSDTKELNILQ
jgi:hypothetical protein